MDSNIAAIAYGLASAISWGAGDFSGGMATRRISVLSVQFTMHGVGLALMIALGALTGEALPSGADLLWGAAAGASGAVGLAALYRALAIGRMGVAAPLTAVLATIIPVIFSGLVEGLPGPPQLAGFALALLSVWFISNPDGAGKRPDGLNLIVLSGTAFGAFSIFIDQIESGSFFWPLASARTASLLIMGGAAWATGQPWRPPRHLVPLIVLVGVLDVGGNAFFLLSTQAGRLDVASVLTSLYPAITVLLARLVLKEQITRPQTVGIGAALGAIALIAL